MSETYALNKLSNVVSKIDPDLLAHPVIGQNLVEVDEPDACIGCGEQPTEVTTTAGEEIVLSESRTAPIELVDTAPKPRRKAKTYKEDNDG